MDYVTFKNNARRLTNTYTSGTSQFTDGMIVDFANLAIDELSGNIVRADESAMMMTSYTDLVANQRAYELPSDMANRIVKLEIKLDGTNWTKAEEVDFNEIDTPISSEADIIANSTNNPVRYSLYRSSIYIWSSSAISAVSQGLRLYYNVKPHRWTTTDLSSTNDISLDYSATDVGFPEEFHPVLLYKVTKLYKVSRDKPIPLNEYEQSIDKMLAGSLANYKNSNRDRKQKGVLPVDYGYNY